MDGKPLLGAFEQPPAVATVASWEEVDGPHADGRHPASAVIHPVE